MLFLISLLFAFCCFLNYWRVVILTALQATTVVYFLCTGGNGHGVAVVWISACVCLVSACSSSWYVLYLFVRFSFGLLSTCVTTGWIFEISLCEDSIQFNSIQLYADKFRKTFSLVHWFTVPGYTGSGALKNTRIVNPPTYLN